MSKSKVIISKKAEEEAVDIIVGQVIKNNMTISNFKEIASKVINYMENNATLKIEDPDCSESSTINIHSITEKFATLIQEHLKEHQI